MSKSFQVVKEIRVIQDERHVELVLYKRLSRRRKKRAQKDFQRRLFDVLLNPLKYTEPANRNSNA